MNDEKELLAGYKQLVEEQQETIKLLRSELRTSNLRVSEAHHNLDRLIDKYSNSQVLPTKVLVSDV